MSYASSRSPQRKSESHRSAARLLSQMGRTTKIATALCECRCHGGYSAAHRDEKCRCRGGNGFMAKPAGPVVRIRLSRRVLFFLEGTGAYAVRNDPAHADYVDVIVRAMNGKQRKDGSVTVECTDEEAVELMVRGDDLAVASGDGASDMSMGVGDWSQTDSLADMNAGRALVEQVYRVVGAERVREIQAAWQR